MKTLGHISPGRPLGRVSLRPADIRARPRVLQAILCLVLTAAWTAAAPPAAHAGIFDQLKSAVQNQARALENQAKSTAQNKADAAVREKAQAAENQALGGVASPPGGSVPNASAQNGTDPDHPLHLTGEGHCHGQNTATCLDYMDVMTQCLAPLNGYRAQLMAERIDKRLKEDSTLSADQRKNLEEDRAAFRSLAEKKLNEDPTLAGVQHSQRYLSDVSTETQIWVNAEYGRMHNRIMNKCEGADHMGVGHRTELIKDFGPTGDEAVAQYRKTHPATPQRSARSSCLQSVSTQSGLRFSIMADMMEKKMQTLKLSAKQRSEWQADIAAVRKSAAAGGTTMPAVDDPVNPYRPMTRLTPQERVAASNEYLKETQAAIAACQKLPNS